MILAWKSMVTGYEARFLMVGKICTVRVRSRKKIDGVGFFYCDWSNAWGITT